ncbi:MAG: hypothetical protein HYV63_11955 [Candidatus Schekmanbacteria bacterium]|nr:hypothetical protein [Candidatus Schekmanbacteria bacterium]
MKKRVRVGVAIVAVTMLLAMALTATAALIVGVSAVQGSGDATQQFQLQPGWNAIFVEVQPEPRELDTLLASTPEIEAVFASVTRVTTAEFIEDLGEPKLKDPDWRWYFPSSRPESFMNTLTTLLANRPYLVKVGGAAAVTWTIQGRPVPRTVTWTPDAFTLTGLPIDPAVPVTFADYFEASITHAGQPVYGLSSATGAWESVAAATTAIQSGAAYWVYTKGSSAFTAPIEVKLAGGDETLDFGTQANELTFAIHNRSDAARTVAVAPATADVPLTVPEYDQTQQTLLWKSFPGVVAQLDLDVPAGDFVTVRLRVQRADLGSGVDGAQTLLSITDGEGVRFRVPVSVSRALSPDQARLGQGMFGRFSRVLAQAAGTSPTHPGLWVGTATINAVSEAFSSTDNTTPKPTAQDFSFRLVVHVDKDNNVRLVREVTQLWKEAVTDAGGTVTEPGRLALITDPSLLTQSGYSGARLIDGEVVGQRISTMTIDFPDQAGEPPATLPLSGDFGAAGDVLTVTVSIPADHPTNPFFHLFHPDHDNQNASYSGYKAEAYAISRALTLTFGNLDPAKCAPLDSPPANCNPPGWGERIVGGTYRESVTGLHRRTIYTSGTFRLQRMGTEDELNG